MLPVFAYTNSYSVRTLFAGKPRSNGAGLKLAPTGEWERAGLCLTGKSFIYRNVYIDFASYT